MVSGTISLPSRGTFHHSLTVLSAIGHQEVFSLTRWSWQIHTGFHGSRATRVSPHTPSSCFAYGTLTHYGHVSHRVRLQPLQRVSLMLEKDGQPHNTAHAIPARLTHTRFRLVRVRSPLLTESQLFSLPVGTEMFHFPTFPPHTLYIQMRVTTHNMPRGFPIRTPSDHRSFINSPRLIADYRVLHRLLMPRHPPCALEHSHHHHAYSVTGSASRITQETQQQKLHRTPQPHPPQKMSTIMMSRCSRPL